MWLCGSREREGRLVLGKKYGRIFLLVSYPAISKAQNKGFIICTTFSSTY